MKRRFSAMLLMTLFAALFACTESTIAPVPISVEGVVLNKATTSILVGAKETLSAVVTPTEAENKAVAWSSSDESIATVSAAGEVTGVAAGTATITVTTKDGAKTATCAVTVSKTVVPVTGVTLSSETMTMAVAATATLTATVAPAEATNQNVDWSTSDAAIATVSAQGVVTGVAAGTATITVTTIDGAKTAVCEVTVSATAVSVTGVTLDKATETVDIGATFPLVATVAPAEATNKTVVWSSSDESKATVSADGVVKGVSAGTATITVTTQDGNKTATCEVTVSATAVTGVTLNSETMTMAVAATATLTATIAPAEATNKVVIWSSSDAAIATVSAAGVVTGVAAGTATITVTTIDGAKTATCVVTVSATAVSVTGVTLDKATETVIKGSTFSLAATVAPAEATNKTVVWSSSDESKATVSDQGVVTGVAAGTATITVTTQDGNHTATCDVTVSPIAVTGVTFDKTTETVILGKTITLVAMIAPADADNKAVTWRSNNVSAATVSADGVVTGLGGTGQARITVTTQDGNHTAYCDVTVTVLVTGITLDKTTETVGIGNTAPLIATIAPANAEYKAVDWSSSDASIATVSTAGVVTGVAAGTATITVTARDGSNQTASCVVTVSAVRVPVTGVSLDEALMTGVIGKTFTLVATVAPADASNKAVLWSSSDESIATVSAAGMVTGVAAGLATITVTTEDGGHRKSCIVTVKELLKSWAEGNLVADGAGGCKIGAPGDDGLYFHFGSLVGWKGGATGDGVGNGSGGEELPVEIQVQPVGYTGSISWPAGYYAGISADDKGYNLPFEDVPASGIGDPCRYYLGDTWRTPTITEYTNLVGASGANTNKGVPLTVNNTTLSFPASGYRNTSNGEFRNVGSYGYYWSSSSIGMDDSFFLQFRSDDVRHEAKDWRHYAYPVRCVSENSVGR